MPESERNIQSTAFVGVVGLGLKVPFYMLFNRSIDTTKFIKFLKKLRKKFGRKKLVIYMDNLRVHISNLVKEAYWDLDIEPIFAPAYSPEYNPIEFVFAILKQTVKTLRLQDMLQRKKRSYEKLIEIAVNKLTVR